MNKKQQNKFLKIFSYFKNTGLGFTLGAFLVLGIFIFTLYSSAAWINPTANPTAGNVTGPIYVGTSTAPITQTRYGTLRLGTTTPSVVSDLMVYNGVISIATTSVNTGLLAVNNGTGVAINAAGGFVSGVHDPALSTDAVNMGFSDGRYLLNSTKLWAGSVVGNIYNNNSGNVGIGTTIPGSLLHVSGPQSGAANNTLTGSLFQVNGSFYVRVKNGTAGISGQIYPTQLINGLGAGPLEMYTADSQPIVFGTNSTERMKLDTSGNMIIGNYTSIGPGVISLLRNDQYWYFFSGTDGNSPYMSFVGRDYVGGLKPGVSIALSSVGSSFEVFNGNYVSSAFKVLNGGNVGIGTSNPTYGLDVQGTLRFAGTGVGNPNLLYLQYNTATTGMFLGVNSSGGFNINRGSDSTNMMTILNTGNVGIGTTNPLSTFSVEGSNSTGLIQATFTNNSAVSTYKYVSYGAAGNNTAVSSWNNSGVLESALSGGFNFSAYAGDIIFQTGASRSERVRILNSNGNVGIGTTNPGSALEVATNGALYTAGAALKNLGGVISPNLGFVSTAGSRYIRQNNLSLDLISDAGYVTASFLNNGNVGIGTTNPALGAGGTGTVLKVYTNNSPQATELNIAANNTNDALYVGGLGFLSGSPDNTRQTLISSSNEGSNAATANGQLRFFTANGGTLAQQMVITKAGNMGIGVAVPLAKLDVRTPGTNTTMRLTNDSNSYNNDIEFYSVNTIYERIRANANTGFLDIESGVNGSGHSIRFLTDNGERMKITSGGNVGIGTSNPTNNLQIGSLAVSGTASPLTLSLGGTYSTTAGANPKLKLYQDSSVSYGLGVSASSLDSIVPTGAAFNWYVDGASKMTLDTNGNLVVTGQVSAGPGDLAEEFYTDRDYPAGTVLVMDDNGYKSARASQKEYDQTVIGVVSEKPGLVIGKIEAKYKAPVVLNGVTKVKVNSASGKIHKGDMLTSSAIKGEAMKAANPKLGTIIGKALEDDIGKGFVMALVNLK